MPKVSVESATERLLRYRRKAQECRDRAVHALDQVSRRHFTAVAEHYDLLIAIENESVRAG